ncbi:enoyl-CoA hydratase [Alkalicoccus urumqiensis]|uniref:Enoyl-CoA hydratase n=1 Tax=Alkalicoccus urumqiensis TaxID=1548213 RepID=A0A2P6MFC5_ALKUR|nr:enoyl-CoA hydratase [Alkalicoccus urumqiensis]PRO64950.1 enoyl-CoA hydratase [Alkalicoccus urumqiensis]
MSVHVERTSSTAKITIDTPPANALSHALIQRIGEVHQELLEDESVKVIILTGSGRFFAAGADITEFTEVKHGSEFSNLARDGQRVFRQLETSVKPVIAVMHGAALGGGLELAMACHLRIAAEGTKLGLPELNLGLIPGFAGTQRLPKLVGRAKALELMLTASPIDAREAAACGLVNSVVPEEDLMQAAETLAAKMAEKSSGTIQAVMELTLQAEWETIDRGQEREAVRFGDVFDHPDAKEGIQAFLDKRKPAFKE